jgi:ribosomal protein L24E
MGYAVYRDPDDSSRWAGYAVPAECDWPDCAAKIDRGLGYKCEEHGEYELQLNGVEIDEDDWDDNPDAEEVWVENEGCGLFFCSEHENKTEEHGKIVLRKPDSIEWLRHMMTDESWERWRRENVAEADEILARIAAA